MKRLFESKVFTVSLAICGLIALILLSASLRDFSFRTAESFPFNITQTKPSLLPDSPEKTIPLWQLILFGVLLLFIVIFLYLLLDREMRKKLLYRMARMGLLMLSIWIALQYVHRPTNSEPDVLPLAGKGQDLPNVPQTVMPEYVPPQINPWLVFAVSFGIALVLVLIAWFFYTRRPKTGQSSMDEIAGIAREARQSLQDGDDWDSAIVRCYVRMSEIVNRERGLVRQVAATPAEFALHLERSGLPGEAVRTLTHLFEGVRYGGKTTSAADRDMASAALSAILHYCGVEA